MAIIGIILLVIFVPLIMIVVGMSLINSSAESISKSRKEMKGMNAEKFANKFFTSHGVNAAWETYIDEFRTQYGRLPIRDEIKVPRERAGDVAQLMEVCRQRGIPW